MKTNEQLAFSASYQQSLIAGMKKSFFFLRYMHAKREKMLETDFPLFTGSDKRIRERREVKRKDFLLSRACE